MTALVTTYNSTALHRRVASYDLYERKSTLNIVVLATFENIFAKHSADAFCVLKTQVYNANQRIDDLMKELADRDDNDDFEKLEKMAEPDDIDRAKKVKAEPTLAASTPSPDVKPARNEAQQKADEAYKPKR